MLGKLFVSEIKQTYKPVTIAAVVMLLSTLLSNLETTLFLRSNISRDNVFSLILSTLLGLIFVGSIIALEVGGFIFLTINFYKSMYSERGYLTHTLPVKTRTIFNVKVIVASLLMFVSAVLGIFCFLLRATNITEESFKELFTRILGYVQISGFDFSELIFIGKSPAATIAILVAKGLLGIVGTFLIFFSAMTIGQLSAEHKSVCSVGAGIGLYLLQQIVGAICLLSLVTSSNNIFSEFANLVAFINKALGISMILSLVFVVAEYIVNIRIVSRHLNLQ